MTEKKTLTLKSKRKTDGTEPKKRRGKRLFVNPNAGKPAKRKSRKPPKKRQAAQARRTPPSELKARALDRLLTERFDAWRTYQPLRLGIEREIFQLIGGEHLPYSKRVVQIVLKRHTKHREYLTNTQRALNRVTLSNELSGAIRSDDKAYASVRVKDR